MKQKKKRQGVSRNVHYCPYCGARTELRSADGIYHDNRRDVMLYVCKNYPQCDTYVRVVPGTTNPMGTLANGRLRALRTEAHRSFDRLHLKGIMSRQEAYQWLSAITGLPMKHAHIGDMGEYYCDQVIQESKKLMDAQMHSCVRESKQDHRKGGCLHGTDAGAAACS